MRHKPRPALVALAGAFVLTGFSALAVEQIFEKLLSTVIGASTPAGTIVLAVYFLGLTLGSGVYSLVAARLKRPLLLYGWLEGFVGAWALLLAVFFPHIYRLSSAIIHLGGDAPLKVFVLRLAVAGLWILPPTFAMGMSFPSVVGSLQQLEASDIRRGAAGFYALNLLGAVAAAATGPYLLFPRVGLIGTLAVITLIQIVVVATVLVLCRNLPPRGKPSESPTSHNRSLGQALQVRSGTLLLVAVAFASGFVFFGFEVLWFHLMGAVLGMSVYAFANMLTVVLAGLFVGGLLSSALYRRSQTPDWLLPAVILIAATLLSWTLGAWDEVQELMVRWSDHVNSFAEGEVVRLTMAAVVVGLPAIALGLVYPLLFRSRRYAAERADAFVGILGAANAIGSILGALATGFLLLPMLGSEAVYRLYIFALVVMALSLTIPGWLGRRRHDTSTPGWIRIGLTVAALGIVIRMGHLDPWEPLRLTSGANVYFQHKAPKDKLELLYWHEDLFGGFTTVVQRYSEDTPFRTLLTNGKFQGSDGAEMAAQIGFALVPIIHQPRRNRALVIGLGTGHTASVVVSAGYGQVEIAEISPGIISASSQLFQHINQAVLESSNVSLAVEDGRNYLLRSPHRYDLIGIELTSVWFAGASNLYSREFYQLAKDRLAAGGVFQQWIQFHHIAPAEVMSAIATLRDVFEQVTVWFFGNQGILLASDSPLQIDRALLERLPQLPEMKRHHDVLATFAGIRLQDLGGFVLLNAEESTRLWKEVDYLNIPLNTDSNRYLEYATPRHNLERRNHLGDVLLQLLSFVEPSERMARIEHHLAEGDARGD